MLGQVLGVGAGRQRALALALQRQASGEFGGPALQMAKRQFDQRDDPLVPVVQARDVVELLAARAQEGFARSSAISSSVSRQSAANPGHMTSTRMTPAAGQAQRRVGVRLAASGAPEAALERDADWSLPEAEPLAEQARRLLALAVVRVAERQASASARRGSSARAWAPALRSASDSVTLAGQRVDVAGVVVIRLTKRSSGSLRERFGPLRDRVDRAGGRRGRILRVQRQNQDACVALPPSRLSSADANRRRRSASRAAPDPVATLAEVAASSRACLRVHAFSGEPSGVQTVAYLAPTGRPRAQDHAMKDRPPDHARDLDDARVAQELAQGSGAARRVSVRPAYRG